MRWDIHQDVSQQLASGISKSLYATCGSETGRNDRSCRAFYFFFFFLNIFLVIIVYAIQFVPLAFFTDAYCSIEGQQVHMGRPEVHVDRLTINYPLDHVVQLVIANGRAARIYVIRVSYIICRGVGESKTWQ